MQKDMVSKLSTLNLRIHTSYENFAKGPNQTLKPTNSGSENSKIMMKFHYDVIWGCYVIIVISKGKMDQIKAHRMGCQISIWDAFINGSIDDVIVMTHKYAFWFWKPWMMNFNIQTLSLVNIAIQMPKISFQKMFDFQWNSHMRYVSLSHP